MDVREMARMGGIARTQSMTAKERRELATKASRAAAVARAARARHKKNLKAMEKSVDAIEKTGRKLDALTKARKKKSSEKRLGAKLRD